MRQAKIKAHHPIALLALLAVGVVVTGLLALVNVKPAWASQTFEPAPNSPVTVGLTPTTVTNADFDADGKMDLAAQNAGSNTVSVRLGNGDGTFRAKPDVAVGSGPTSVTSADLNDDGKLDLAVSNQFSNSVTVRLGNGDGTFPARQDFQAGFDPTSVISANINGDSFADLAVANYSSGSVSVLLGQDVNGDGKADGTFQQKTDFLVYRQTCNDFLCVSNTAAPNQVITADFNGDAKADLATANIGGCIISCAPGGVSVLLGNGNGTFQNATLAMGGTAITSIDTNNSGDIAATKYNDNVVSVLRSNGNGTFVSGPQLSVGLNPSAVTSEDLDGDARPDLAVSNFASDNVSVLINDGGGGFRAAQNFQAGDGPAFVIGAHLNDDNFADLAVANQNSNNVSVLLNTVPAPETTISRGPSDPNNITTATFEFTSSEPGSTFQCALDDPSSYSPCTSPETVPDAGLLDDGPHTFYVKATGAAGNTDRTPAAYTWKVDTTAPTVSDVSPSDQAQNAPPGTNVNATFSEAMNASTITASTFTLKKQNASTTVAALVTYDPATRRATLNPDSDLAPNTTYTATIKGGSSGAKDLAGNTLQQDYSWTLTTAIPPETTVTAGPSGRVNDTQATFEFTSSVADSSFKCRVNSGVSSGSWGDCASAWNVGSLADAFYTFEVYAIDPAGNQDPTPARQSWTVDTIAPTVKSTSPAKRATGVARRTNVSATLSEEVDATSIGKSNFKLFKCASATPTTCTTQVTNVTVTTSADGLKATLNPYGASQTLLAKGTRYKAVVTTGAKDEAGNALANNYTWTFTTVS